MARKKKQDRAKPTCEDLKTPDDHALDLSALQNPRQRAFLAAISLWGTRRKAARASHVSRSSHDQWMREDPVYALAYKEALEVCCERKEEVLHHLATVGRKRKIFHQGKPVIDPETKQQYVEYEIDTTALIFDLKAMNPEKYRDNVRHEVTGKDGGPVKQETTVTVVTDLEKCARRFDDFASRISNN